MAAGNRLRFDKRFDLIAPHSPSWPRLPLRLKSSFGSVRQSLSLRARRGWKMHKASALDRRSASEIGGGALDDVLASAVYKEDVAICSQSSYPPRPRAMA